MRRPSGDRAAPITGTDELLAVTARGARIGVLGAAAGGPRSHDDTANVDATSATSPAARPMVRQVDFGAVPTPPAWAAATSAVRIAATDSKRSSRDVASARRSTGRSHLYGTVSRRATGSSSVATSRRPTTASSSTRPKL